MKKLTSLLLIAVFAVSCTSLVQNSQDTTLFRKVNPLIGTDGPGNVYPGAQYPFGLVQLSPDNGISGWDRIAGYFYPDSTIAGFSHTHLSGTGAGDLYDILFMPAVAPYQIGKGELGLHSKFSHSQEKAWAGYYSVMLESYDIQVELTATEHCGAQRYTFNRGSDSALVNLNLFKSMNWDFPMGSKIEILNDSTIQGYRYSEGWATDQKVYFYTQFSQPFNRSEILDKFTKHSVEKYNNIANQNANFYFTVKDGGSVEVLTAISGVSMEGAKRNFEAEVAGSNFLALVNATEQTWEKELQKIEVKGGTKDEQIAFYTALYRTMLAPVVYSDVDGAYRGADKQIHTSDKKTYSTFSLWDTYRAEHPLLTFTHPERVSDMVASFIDFAEQSGALPVWNMWACETDMMIGYHSVPVMVEAFFKGIPMDANRALEAMIKTANRDQYRGLGDLKKIGYLPAEKHIESVSKTLEYAYDDYCISVMALKMGRNDVANEFQRRSKAYLDLYNEQSGFFQPKDINGKWLPNFNPNEYTEHFCESNAWHYRFLQHDVAPQVALMGVERFEAALDSMFLVSPAATDSLPIFSTGMIGQYAHGNEPSHHVAYLYNAVGRHDKTQLYVDSIMRSQYSALADGVCGNEDCGQMSAWYVFSAMGFYPVDPVSLRYELGVPLFPEVVMTLPNGKTFKVTKSHSGAQSKEIKLNGEVLETRFITWSEIMAGGTLEFI